MAISVPVNPGMSGGPLLNNNYEVIGVNVMGYRGKQAAAYGINIDRVRNFLGKKIVVNLKELIISLLLVLTISLIYSLFNHGLNLQSTLTNIYIVLFMAVIYLWKSL